MSEIFLFSLQKIVAVLAALFAAVSCIPYGTYGTEHRQIESHPPHGGGSMYFIKNFEKKSKN